MKSGKLFALLIIVTLIPIISCSTPEEKEESEVQEKTVTEQQSGDKQSMEDSEQKAAEVKDAGEMATEAEGDAEQDTDDKAKGEPEKLDEELVAMGKETYSNKGCVACHSIGKGKLVGPDLLGVTERRDNEWLTKWLKNPDEMLKTDPIAKEMLKEYMVPMPNQGLSDKEVEALIAYMKYEHQQNKQ